MADNDFDLKSDYTDVYEVCHAGWDNFLLEAQLNMDYYFGAQWTGKEQAMADRAGRWLPVINKMRRQINLLHGYEIKNRHILKIGPVEGQDDEATGQHTGIIMHLMSSGNVSGYNVLSDGFKWGPLISGSNLLEIWKDRNGDLKHARHGYNGFLLDPGLTQRDGSDNDNILLGQWVSNDKVEMLLPQGADKIGKIPVLSTSERWDYLGPPVLANKAKKRLYERWYRREIKYVSMIANRMSGKDITYEEFLEKMGGNEEYAQAAIDGVRMSNGTPILVKYSKPVSRIRLTIFIDGEPVFDDPDPMKMNDYSFVWLNGDWAPECKRDELKLQGFASTLRDPQKARIRRSCQALDIMESALHTLRMMRGKYVKNPKAAYRTGQGTVLHIKDDTPLELPNAEIFSQVGAPDVPQGIFTMMEILDKDMTEAGGLNEEIFGSEDKDIPAILSRHRTGQALTGQAGVFENFRSGKRELGRKSTRLVQLHYEPSKVHRILNEWPVPGFYEEDFTKYDCTPTEGVYSDTQQHLFYLEMKHLRETFPDFAQVLTPSIMVDILPIQFKKKLKQHIEQQEQQQQQQQQEALADKKRMDALIEAQTGERLSADLENRSNAKLDNVRAMVDMSKIMNDAQLDKIDRMIKLVELKQRQEELRIKGQTEQKKLTKPKKKAG